MMKTSRNHCLSEGYPSTSLQIWGGTIDTTSADHAACSMLAVIGAPLQWASEVTPQLGEVSRLVLKVRWGTRGWLRVLVCPQRYSLVALLAPSLIILISLFTGTGVRAEERQRWGPSWLKLFRQECMPELAIPSDTKLLLTKNYFEIIILQNYEFHVHVRFLDNVFSPRRAWWCQIHHKLQKHASRNDFCNKFVSEGRGCQRFNDAHVCMVARFRS